MLAVFQKVQFFEISVPRFMKYLLACFRGCKPEEGEALFRWRHCWNGTTSVDYSVAVTVKTKMWRHGPRRRKRSILVLRGGFCQLQKGRSNRTNTKRIGSRHLFNVLMKMLAVYEVQRRRDRVYHMVLGKVSSRKSWKCDTFVYLWGCVWGCVWGWGSRQ